MFPRCYFSRVICDDRPGAYGSLWDDVGAAGACVGEKPQARLQESQCPVSFRSYPGRSDGFHDGGRSVTDFALFAHHRRRSGSDTVSVGDGKGFQEASGGYDHWFGTCD